MLLVCWFVFLKTISVGRRKFSASFQLMFRLIKGLIFMTFIAIIVILITLAHMTIQDIIVCILAFMPTGWGMLLVSKNKGEKKLKKVKILLGSLMMMK